MTKSQILIEECRQKFQWDDFELSSIYTIIYEVQAELKSKLIKSIDES